MARTGWATERYADVLDKLAQEFGVAAEPVGRRRNHLSVRSRHVRLGFGRGQVTNQRGIKGFPKATTETFYLEVPGPVDPSDLVVAVVAETELVFEANDFLRVAGRFAGWRYLPNFFRDTRDGRFWARVADLDVNYPLDAFVAAWPARAADRSAPQQDGSQAGEASLSDDDPTDPTDPFIRFKPRDASDYRSHIEGRTIVKTRTHETLVADFGLWAATLGFSPSTIDYPRDLLLRQASRTILVEAKVLYRGNATLAVRSAIGQLMTYRYLLHPGEDIELCALFSEPVGPAFVDLLQSLAIATVWRDANGRWQASDRARAVGLAPTI